MKETAQLPAHPATGSELLAWPRAGLGPATQRRVASADQVGWLPDTLLHGQELLTAAAAAAAACAGQHWSSDLFPAAAMGKTKKKVGGAKKRAQAAAEMSQEEAREELLALEAIFGEDLAVHEGSLGFSLRVVPHPGEAAANHVSLMLVVRCGAMAVCGGCRLQQDM